MDNQEIIKKYKEAQKEKQELIRYAKQNQKFGGKGTKAERKINIRKILAKYCGISEDSYRKLDKIMNSGKESVIDCLENGKLTINKAYKKLEDRAYYKREPSSLGSTWTLYIFVEGKTVKIGSEMFPSNWHENEYYDKIPEWLQKEFHKMYQQVIEEYNEEVVENRKSSRNKASSKRSENRKRSSIDVDEFQKEWKGFYRDLSKIYHPDNQHGSTEKMATLNTMNDTIKGVLELLEKWTS